MIDLTSFWNENVENGGFRIPLNSECKSFDLHILFSDAEETLSSESVLREGGSRHSYIFLLLEVWAPHKPTNVCRIQVLASPA